MPSGSDLTTSVRCVSSLHIRPLSVSRCAPPPHDPSPLPPTSRVWRMRAGARKPAQATHTHTRDMHPTSDHLHRHKQRTPAFASCITSCCAPHFGRTPCFTYRCRATPPAPPQLAGHEHQAPARMAAGIPSPCGTTFSAHTCAANAPPKARNMHMTSRNRWKK